MKIKVKNIESNPFRNLSSYPIDREKIDNLKISISKTGFWDNVLMREHPTKEGVYQIAYGHHRLAAVRELGVEEIEAPVKELSDVEMIQIMADENYEYGAKDIRVVNETVASAKAYIENEINTKNGIYDDLEDWCKELFNGKQGFITIVGLEPLAPSSQGLKVGHSVIKRFLGDNWGKESIKHSLKLLEGITEVTETITNPDTDEKVMLKIPAVVSKEAAEEFPIIKQSRAFTDAITKDPAGRIAFATKEAQIKIAKEIKADGPTTSSTITASVHEKALERLHNSQEEVKEHDDKIKEEFFKTSKPKPVSKSKDIMKEFGRIFDRLKLATHPTNSKLEVSETYIDPARQRIFTEEQAQALQNTLFEMEMFIHVYGDKITTLTGITPNKECINYDCYPNALDYDTDFIENIWEDTNTEEVEIEISDLVDGPMSDEEEEWLNGWLLGKTTSVDDND